ncbi:MAG: IclR family transcriptional regulator [Solirubrobacteraceae bacterium]
MTRARVQVLERSIDCLVALSCGPRTMTEVARATDLPKGTAHRLLLALGYENLVVRDPVDSRYTLGPGFLRLVMAAVEGMSSMTSIARPSLVGLSRKTEETILLHTRVGVERVCIEEIPSLQAIRYSAAVGTTAPIYLGSAGRVILAFSPEDQQQRLLESVNIDASTSPAFPTVPELTAELQAIRERGWASSLGERVPGGAAISVPVQWESGLVLALSVMGPADRFTRERQMSFLPDMQQTAKAIEASAGAL